jgi:ABC-2 type transport system ATP-binding protein
MSRSVIEVTDLVKVYKEKTRQAVRALDGLSLQVSQGEIFGILGPNGAGKTTLLRILTTLTRPTSGSASVFGLDVLHRPLEVRKNICVVLQENAVELFLSVEDNLKTYARFHSVPHTEISRLTRQVVEQFGLGEYRRQKVIDLSGGLKRRVQVAKVFMVDKPVVFLDEATTGMDPINKRATIEAIRDQSCKGRTIVLSTHILQEAEDLCDSIAIIDHGRCIAKGNLPSIKAVVSSAFDILLTFESLTDEMVRKLQQLPLLRFSRSDNSVEMSVRVEDLFNLDLIAQLARSDQITHIEVNSSTLEDAFFQLVGHRGPQASATRPGAGIAP